MDLEALLGQARERRANHLAKSEAILAGAKDGDKPRDLNEDERKAFDAELELARAAGADCSRFERLIAEKASAVEVPQRRTAPETPGREQGIERRSDVRVLRRHGKLRSFRGATANDDAYASGQWVLATLGGDSRAAEWCRTNGIETRALSGGSNSLGGFLVPDQMETAIIDLREDRGVARQNVRIRGMSGDTLIIPRRASGVTAYFVNDNAEITASDKGWDAVTLTARKLAVLCKYSSEIAEDAVISIADDLAMEIAYAFADKEDECLFNGDGTSTYGGIVGIKNALAAGSEFTAATGNTAFSTLDLDDFEGMVGKLPKYAEAGAKWYISKAGWASSMLRLAEAAGGNTTAQVAQGVQLQFLGYPVVITQVMNSTLTAQTSTEGLAYLGNLDLGVSMGARRGVSIDVDKSRYFELDQLAIKGTQRFDINVHEKGTASVAGPIIQLLTPGS